MAFFEKPWFKRGRFNNFLKKNNIAVDDMRLMFKDFSENDLCKALLLAMDDFAEEIDIDWMALDVSDPAYDKKMAALQQKRKFKGWFKRLISDFVGLETSANDNGRGNIRKYIDGVKDE